MKKMGVSLLILCILSGCNDPVIELEKDVFTFEYGEMISLKAETYLSTSCKKQIGDEEQIKVIFFNLKQDADVIDVGEYQGEISYKKQHKKFKIQVKDTKKPIFTLSETKLELPLDCDIEDVLANFKAEDVVKEKKMNATVFVDGKIDFAKEGRYEVNIVAEDQNHNKTILRCEVFIKEEREQKYEELKDSVSKKDKVVEPPKIQEKPKEEGGKIPSFEEEKPVYVLPQNYVDENGTHYEYFWSEEEVLQRFMELKDVRYHNCYFDDYETEYFELMWWE